MEGGELALVVLFSFIAIIGLLGNIFVGFIILQHRPVRRSMNCLFLNLAISDTAIVIFLAFRHLIIRLFAHPTGAAGDYLCKFVTGGNLAWIGAVSSVSTLVCIALERYYMVIKPSRYLNFFKVNNIKRGIYISWMLSILFNLPLFVVLRYDAKKNFCYEDWSSSIASKCYATIWLSAVAVIPSVIMCVLYSQIIYVLWIKKNEITSVPYPQIAICKARKKITKIVVTVSLIYCVSWFPPLIDYVMMVFAPAQRHLGDIPHVAAVLMIVLNASVNPLVYTFESERFRKQIKMSLCCYRTSDNAVNPMDTEHEQTWIPPLQKQRPHTPPPAEEQQGSMSKTGVDFMFLWLTGT